MKQLITILFFLILALKISQAQVNLTPYQPAGWDNKIVFSTVTGTNTSASAIYSDQIIYLDWAVTNIGSVNITQNFINYLDIDGVRNSSWTITGIKANSFISHTDVAIGPFSAGTYTFRIVVDALHAVTETNETDNQYSRTITILPCTVPAKPSLGGVIGVCQEFSHGTTITYDVPLVSGATSYTWTLPSGWSGTSTSNSITVTTGDNSGTISLTANNSCGSSTPATLYVNIQLHPAQPGMITGSTTVCQGSSQTYSIEPVSGATSYTWTLPSGWSGSSTSTSINATAGVTSGDIRVRAVAGCSGEDRILAVNVVTVPSQPAVIIGSTSVCPGTAQEYKVVDVSGATSYTWTVPSGWGASSTTNQLIGVVPSFNSGTISVIANNSCGSSVPRTLYITVPPSPDQPGAITGSNFVCQGSSYTYSISSVSGATSYSWVLPAGWSGNSTTTSISVTTGASGGYISVSAKSSCNSMSTRLSVTIASKPTVTTSSIRTLSSTAATGGGNILSNGGGEVIVSGLCWSTSPDPTTSNSKTIDGLTIGSFTSTINGLAENVTYYIRAFATNCSGTGYGTNVEYNSSNAIEVIQSSEISIYPNPVSGILNIGFKNGTYKIINVINPQGVLLKIEKVISHQQQLDFSKYEPGLYILEFVKPGGEIERVRIIHH
jgi:hypothetical protein